MDFSWLWILFDTHQMWMSSGIFAESLIEAHNLEMADRHQTKPYPLRMPDDLRERLDKAAASSGRSLNAEIVAALESSFVGAETVILRNRREELALLRSEIEPLVHALARLAETDKGRNSEEFAAINDRLRRLRDQEFEVSYRLDRMEGEAAQQTYDAPMQTTAKENRK